MIWVSDEDLKTDRWKAIVYDFRPEVLVTAWKAPRLLDDPDALPASVKYICNVTGSIKGIVSRPMLENGLLVTNWGNAISHTIAEHALLLTLASLRLLPRWPYFLKEKSNKEVKNAKIQSLFKKRVGLHGFGAIARELVQILKPFQVSVSAYSEGVPSELFSKQGVHQSNSLEALFSGSDVLIECEALTPSTRGIVTKALLLCLPEDAVFVNIGRGAVADEEALAQLAREGRLRVALDVYQKEPLPDDSPLFQVPQVILSPHIGGPTSDSYVCCGEFALKNLQNYFSGQPLEGLVTLPIYDRTT